LTTGGVALLADVRPLVVAIQADILGSLSPEERDDFMALIIKVCKPPD
jgi:hypothetical protein